MHDDEQPGPACDGRAVSTAYGAHMHLDLSCMVGIYEFGRSGGTNLQQPPTRAIRESKGPDQ